ncbi:MAG: hypothetical protein NC548_05845 [Lachnospiraceae bacterium]|nr:hypothetical protein [Lachnospiraceae bacterium]
MNGMYTMASASTSSLYGNVGCAIRELILSKFPYNFFKYSTVSTEMAFHNMRRQFGSNTNTEITKRERPYLLVQPVYQVPDPDGFLQNVPLTKNDMDIQSNTDKRYLFEVIKDKPNGWNLKFKLNRDRIEYEVTVQVDTLHQQLDIYKAMLNTITWDRSLYLPAALEAVIPKTMIQYMSLLSKMDIYETPEFIPMFIRHLNKNSGFPITYKIRNASATDEFYMYYLHNLVVTFTDLDIDQGSRRNMANDYFNITFKVIAEFNLPGLFVLDGDMKKLDDFRIELGTKPNPNLEEPDEYIPLFTLSNLFNKYPQNLDGMTLFGTFVFHTDESNLSVEQIDLSVIFDPDMKKSIQTHVSYGMVPETICKLIVLKDRNELDKTEYSIQWNNFTLSVRHPDNAATYRVVAYYNAEAINHDISNTRMAGTYGEHHDTRENVVDYSNASSRTHLTTSTDPVGSVSGSTINGIEYYLPQIYHPMDDRDRPKFNDYIVLVPSAYLNHTHWHTLSPYTGEINVVDGIDSVTPIISSYTTEEMFHHFPNIVGAMPNEYIGEGHLDFTTEEHFHNYPDFIGELPGDCNFDGVVTPGRDFEPEDPQTEPDPPDTPEEPEVPVDPPVSIIPGGECDPLKKYHSSIFDDNTDVDIGEEPIPPSGKRFSSDANPNRAVTRIIIKDSLEPVTVHALDVWAKILSSGILYNYAAAIAIEENENYSVKTELDV